METKDVIRANLKTCLKASGKNQTDLANALGVSPSVVSNWIRGKHNIDIEFVYMSVYMFAHSKDKNIPRHPVRGSRGIIGVTCTPRTPISIPQKDRAGGASDYPPPFGACGESCAHERSNAGFLYLRS